MHTNYSEWAFKISLTNRCNFHCYYCNDYVKNGNDDALNEENITAILKNGILLGMKSVIWTGGECTIGNLMYFSSLAKSFGYQKQALTSNGYLLSPDTIKQLSENGLNRCNISLDSYSNETFKIITGIDGANKVRDNIKFAASYLEQIKINMVVMQINKNEISDLLDYVKSINNYKANVILKLHELWQFHDSKKYIEQYVSTDEILKIVTSFGSITLTDTVVGNNPNAKYYKLDNTNLTIGIAPAPKSFRCGGPTCKRIRVYSNGTTCEGIDLLKNPDDLMANLSSIGDIRAKTEVIR